MAKQVKGPREVFAVMRIDGTDVLSYTDRADLVADFEGYGHRIVRYTRADLAQPAKTTAKKKGGG